MPPFKNKPPLFPAWWLNKGNNYLFCIFNAEPFKNNGPVKTIFEISLRTKSCVKKNKCLKLLHAT